MTTSGHCDSATESAEFQAGLGAYTSENYAQAAEHFRATIGQFGNSPELLHNLALAEYGVGRKALALGLWRKALNMHPGYDLAEKGRNFAEQSLQASRGPQFGLLKSLTRTLESVSLFEYFWLLIFTCGATGWLWIGFFAKRRWALQDDLPLPPFPTAAAGLTILLIGLTAMTLMRLNIQATPRGIVVVDHATVRSLPSDDGVELADLSGGLEVVIERQDEGWIQIQLESGGAGWVKSSEVLGIN